MKILIINAEIGLGHSYYLDAFISACKKLSPAIEIDYCSLIADKNIFRRSFWKLTEFLYYLGSRGGLVTKVYTKVRRHARSFKVPTCKINFREYDQIVVAHPLLAKTFQNTWYLHGELALPRECIIPEVKKIIVPLETQRQRLIAVGLQSSQIVVSGLVLPVNLVANAQKAWQLRLERLKSTQSLKIGFFISGAYPRDHIQKIILGISSVVRLGHRVFLFAGINKRRSQKVLQMLNRQLKNQNSFLPTIAIIQDSNRFYYQRRINELLSALDLMVAPTHEHTTWALGLGIPIFSLFPLIGSYAEENYKFLLDARITQPLMTNSCAKNLGEIIYELQKNGTLVSMAKNGFGKYPIDGAIKSAEAVFKSKRT
ncbi:MAG: hypothetical protein ABIK10_01530 [candidate division WOR-3 bacterium]